MAKAAKSLRRKTMAQQGEDDDEEEEEEGVRKRPVSSLSPHLSAHAHRTAHRVACLSLAPMRA